MAVNPTIECFGRDLIPKYCQGSESSALTPAPPGLCNLTMAAQVGVNDVCR